MGYLLGVNAAVFLLMLWAVAVHSPRTASAPFWICALAILGMVNGSMAVAILFA